MPKESARRTFLDNSSIRGQLEGVRIALARAESAELAGEDAEVRVVDVLIVNVRGDVAVLPFANHIGDHPERIQAL